MTFVLHTKLTYFSGNCNIDSVPEGIKQMTTVNEIRIQGEYPLTEEISKFLESDKLVLDLTNLGMHNRFHEEPKRTHSAFELWYGVDTDSDPLVEELTKVAEKFPNAKIELIYEGSEVGYHLWKNGTLKHTFEMDLEDMEEYDMDDLWDEVRRLKLDVE